MICGETGAEIRARVAVGPVFYQRLHHLVAFKAHARARNGPIDEVTRQPEKGRKHGGGLRFGEMERDAVVAHGASAMLLDRLAQPSESCLLAVRRDTGTLADVRPEVAARDPGRYAVARVPHSMRLLMQELVAMGILPRVTVGGG